jgi:hypothetical protein
MSVVPVLRALFDRPLHHVDLLTRFIPLVGNIKTATKCGENKQQ